MICKECKQPLDGILVRYQSSTEVTTRFEFGAKAVVEHVTDDAGIFCTDMCLERYLRRGDPLPLVLHCPMCGTQHIDAPEPEIGWTNPPHRSHKCKACGCVWRPSDIPTTGVASAGTKGKGDNWP